MLSLYEVSVPDYKSAGIWSVHFGILEMQNTSGAYYPLFRIYCGPYILNNNTDRKGM